MGQLIVFYRQGLRYQVKLADGKKLKLGSSDKDQVFVTGLDQPVILWTEAGGVHYQCEGQEGELVSAMNLAQGQFFLLDDQATILDPLDKQELTLGHHEGHHFIVDEAAYRLLFKKEGQSWQLHQLSGQVYLNNVLLEASEVSLSLGDELAFCDKVFKWYGDEVLVQGPVRISEELARKSDSHHAFYEDYPDYHRSPRIIYRSSEDKVTLNPPAAPPSPPTDGLIKLILPPLMMLGVTLLIMIFQPRGLYVLATITMSLVTTGLSVSGYFKNRRDYQKGVEERQSSIGTIWRPNRRSWLAWSRLRRRGSSTTIQPLRPWWT